MPIIAAGQRRYLLDKRLVYLFSYDLPLAAGAKQFVFMPVRFGSVQDYAHSLAGEAAGARRGGSQKALRDWLVRQPALQITLR